MAAFAEQNSDKEGKTLRAAAYAKQAKDPKIREAGERMEKFMNEDNSGETTLAIADLFSACGELGATPSPSAPG